MVIHLALLAAALAVQPALAAAPGRSGALGATSAPSLKTTPLPVAKLPPSLSAPSFAITSAQLMLAPAASPVALAAPVENGRAALIETLAAELPDLSQAGASQAEASASSRDDFEKRAQLSESWGGRLSGLFTPKLKDDEAALIRERLPALVGEELAVVSPLLRGEALTPEQSRDVMRLTSYKRVDWRHGLSNEFGPLGSSYPDGVAYPDNRIQLSVRKIWRAYASVEDHFRTLFSHEYTHRLQNEGVITRRYGVEIPAVAVEVLRAAELAGLEAIRAGRFALIGSGVLASFNEGRSWAASGQKGNEGFYYKGFLGGAAYELAQATGRPRDAWEFLRRVCSVASPEEPAAVYAEILRR